MPLALALTAATAGLAGWLAAGQLQTPQERAAGRAPDASPVVVPVEERVLTAGLVTRADVYLEDVVDVAAPASLHEAVVTNLRVREGDVLASGDVVAEVAGRPLIALEGDLPAWRDLEPGVEGPDVEQLQRALADLGHYQGSVDGRFGPSTGEAVDRLLTGRGYDATGTPSELAAALADAREQGDRAAEGVGDARHVLDRAAEAARREGEALQLAAQEAASTLEAEERDGERRVGDAGAVVAGAEQALEAARQLLTEATTDEDRETAQAAVDAAESEVAAALDALTTTEREVGEAVGVARATHAEARRHLEEHRATDHTRDLTRALAGAERSHAQALAHLEQLRASAGVRLPAGEVVFVDQLPRRVQEVHVRRGDRLGSELVRLAGERAVAEAHLPLGESAYVVVGAEATLRDAGGAQAAATVVAVEPAQAEGQVRVRLLAGGDVGLALVGRNVRLDLPERTTRVPVLVVPLAALRTVADGTVRVDVQGPDGLRGVPVTPGIEAGGHVEVVPQQDGELSAGDWVVVADAPGADAGRD